MIKWPLVAWACSNRIRTIDKVSRFSVPSRVEHVWLAMSLWFRRSNSLLGAVQWPLVVNAWGVRWRHSRPGDVGEGQRQKMLNRPSFEKPTGRKGDLFFLNAPSAPGMFPGRSDGASATRAMLKHCSSWQRVMQLVNKAKKDGRLEASVFGAAMQVCGSKGWWEGLLELRRIQQEEGVKLFPTELSIALTALSHCLRDERKGRIVPERVPIALKMGKTFWREARPARNTQCLSSALKLATCLNREAAYKWGSEVWSEANRAVFPESHITVSAYIWFLEHYQQCDEVDALLESREKAVSEAVNRVLLGSLLNSTAARQDWQRADSLWDLFMAKGVEPDIIQFRALAKVHLLAGHPARVLDIFERLIPRGRDFTEDLRDASVYAQASLVVCHSSLDHMAISRLQACLVESLEQGPASPISIRKDLLKMRRVLDKLLSEPKKVFLRDVLIEFKAREMSVMAKWDNFPAGSNYLKAEGRREDEGKRPEAAKKQEKKKKPNLSKP